MGINSRHLFILASESPRRREILKSIGLRFKIVPAHVNEKYLTGESPQEHVKRLSRDKATAIARQYPEAWILGADTIVVIDGMVLGKPKNKKQAQNMLKRLSGREHKVFTGFSVVCIASKVFRTKFVQSAVRFKTISSEELAWYVASDEPYDKAGGYAIQGKGSYFIQSIRGSYTNVIGLPLCEVLETLKQFDVIRF